MVTFTAASSCNLFGSENVRSTIERSKVEMLQYSHLPNEQSGLNKRAGVLSNKKSLNGQCGNLPRNRAGVHVFLNDNKWVRVQVCLINGHEG